MVHIHLNHPDRTPVAIALTEGESVLDALLRTGHDIPHGCRGGACQSCLMIADGPVPAVAQQGLKASQKQLGYFCSCLCRPQQDLHLRRAEPPAIHPAEVLDITRLNARVLRLRLAPVFDYRAGQYLNIHHQGCVRSYSIASVSALEDFIELHIKLIDGGRFSDWAQSHLRPGDRLALQGPLGECFYTAPPAAASNTAATNAVAVNAAQADRPLLLIGMGTGLAPLYGIARDALAQGHQGPIHWVTCAADAAHFYYTDTLRELAQRHLHIHLHWVHREPALHASLDTHSLPNTHQADLYAWVKTQFPSLKQYRIYLCGADTFVRKMKKQCFLAGAAMADIHADAFLSGG